MNRAIPEGIVEEIRARADILDVVQSYIPLKKAGQNFKACCPFHQEKTPSFTVNPGRQIFHCFGCGKGGDVFRFVMERENVDFPNAIHILARKYNVYIPEADVRRGSGDASSGGTERANFRDRLYLLHEKMQSWFAKNLRNPELPVSKYLATRGLPAGTVEKFGLGASLDAWDAGHDWARREGFSDDELLAGGLLVESSDVPGRRYDRFRNRLMFPIWNEQGRVVAFSARTIEKEPQGGKYVNSPETPIFKKSRVLYGLHMARHEIGKRGFAILCEGQLDVIAMHRAGLSNAIAPQGTAFTDEQALMLKRYTDKLYLALDADSAGLKAALRAAELALPAGFDLKVVCFPSGKDPDELLKTSGGEAVNATVESAKDFFEFLLGRLGEENGTDSPAGKAATASETLRFVSMLESEAAQASYVSWLASELKLDEPSLISELRRTSRPGSGRGFPGRAKEPAQGQGAASPAAPRSPLDAQFEKALCELLECILQDGVAAALAGHELQPEMLGEGQLAKAVETVIQAKINGEWEDASRLIVEGFQGEPPSPELMAALAKEQSQRPGPLLERTAKDCIRIIKTAHLRKEIDAVKRLFIAAPEGPEREELLKSFNEKSRLLAEINSQRKLS